MRSLRRPRRACRILAATAARAAQGAFQLAWEAAARDAPPSHDSVTRDWRLWLAVRDACPLGREHRYDDDQLRYHYTKDVAALRSAITR